MQPHNKESVYSNITVDMIGFFFLLYILTVLPNLIKLDKREENPFHFSIQKNTTIDRRFYVFFLIIIFFLFSHPSFRFQCFLSP